MTAATRIPRTAADAVRIGLIGLGTVGQALCRLIGDKGLPFEVASIVLLAALIGAVVVSRKEVT